jgi:outer membrane protein assembly factor BamB
MIVSHKFFGKDLVYGWTVLIQVLLTSPKLSRAEPLTQTNEWSVLLPALSDSSPAVASDGTIYFGTFFGDLHALKADGSRKWIFSAGREIKGSPAVGPDGTVYFGSRNRKLYAVQPDGQEKWNFKTGAWVDSSPAVGADGTVYFGSWDKNFYAISSNGTEKWRFQTGGELVSSPAIGADGTIYFGSHDHKLYALTPDGKKTWEYAADGAIVSSPAIDKDGSIYFTSVDGFFYALNPEGSLKWRLKTGGITESSPVIGQDGTIFVGVNEKLWAITPNGKQNWARPGHLFISATPLALADNSVCYLSRDGYLLNVDSPEQYKWVFNLGFGEVAPAIGATGTIYSIGAILNVGFYLYAVSNRVGVAQSPWPKFRGNARNTGHR